MGFYDLYRATTFSTSSDKAIVEGDIVQNIKDNFHSQPNYHQVYKNMVTATPYDVLISVGNVKDKEVGYKTLISYPYDTYVFDNGDYVDFDYGNENSTWLITSLDKFSLYEVKGRIERCNNDLKWVDSNGVIQSYKCIVTAGIREDRSRENKNIVTPDGFIDVRVQYNADTDQVTSNNRFLFNGKAFRVRSVSDLTDNNIITLTMVKDVINLDMDDVANNIANAYDYNYSISIIQDDFEQLVGYSATLTNTLTLNGDENSSAVEWVSSDTNIATINESSGLINLVSTGSVVFTARMVDNPAVSDSITVDVVGALSGVSENIISPNVTEVLRGNTQVYTVYNYVDNVQTADTFTITASGASSDKYTLSIIDGNSFSITGNDYSSTLLDVLCTNDNDSSTKTINIKLKGLW